MDLIRSSIPEMISDFHEETVEIHSTEEATWPIVVTAQFSGKSIHIILFPILINFFKCQIENIWCILFLPLFLVEKFYVLTTTQININSHCISIFHWLRKLLLQTTCCLFLLQEFNSQVKERFQKWRLGCAG